MSLIRVLKTATTVVTHVFYVDESPTSASVGVVVTVTRLDGTVVTTGAGVLGAVGTYTFTVPGQSTLDTLVVTWVATSIGGAVVTAVDTVEVVGGYLFGLAEARALDPPLSSITYPAALLAAKRLEVEQEAEAICRQAFVPRFYRETVSGTGTDRQGLKWMMLRRLRAVTVSGVAWSAPDVAAVPPAENGIARRPGGAVWPEGVGNIVVEYERGWDYPPEEVRAAAMKRLRSLLVSTSSGVPDRAVSWNTQEGGTYRISLPGKQSTGVAAVDAVYERYTRQQRAVFA